MLRIFSIKYVCFFFSSKKTKKRETWSLSDRRPDVRNFVIPSSLNFFPQVRIFSWRYFSLHHHVPCDRIAEIHEACIISLGQAGCGSEICIQLILW